MHNIRLVLLLVVLMLSGGLCNVSLAQISNGNGGGSVTSGTVNQHGRYAATGTIISGSAIASDDGTYFYSDGPVDIKTNSLVIEIANSGSPGTTVNKLVKIPAGAASVLTTSASDVISAIGVVVGGAGTTGSAKIGVLGKFNCLFDNTATTAGDFIIPSSTTAGTCHDAGATIPTSGEVMGQVLSSNSSCGSPPCGPYEVLFGTPDVFLPGSGGSNGNGGTGNGNNSNKSTRKTTCMAIGADNATSVLTDADLGPFSRFFQFDTTQTVLQVTVAADAGTPNIIVGRSRAGSVSNLTSAALATASSGGIACSNTGGTTGIDGATTCTNTLQNTGVNAGDWLTLVSGTAGGTAKEMTVCVTTTVN